MCQMSCFLHLSAFGIWERIASAWHVLQIFYSKGTGLCCLIEVIFENKRIVRLKVDMVFCIKTQNIFLGNNWFVFCFVQKSVTKKQLKYIMNLFKIKYTALTRWNSDAWNYRQPTDFAIEVPAMLCAATKISVHCL